MGLFRFLNQWREKKDGTLEGPALSTGRVNNTEYISDDASVSELEDHFSSPGRYILQGDFRVSDNVEVTSSNVEIVIDNGTTFGFADGASPTTYTDSQGDPWKFLMIIDGHESVDITVRGVVDVNRTDVTDARGIFYDNCSAFEVKTAEGGYFTDGQPGVWIVDSSDFDIPNLLGKQMDGAVLGAEGAENGRIGTVSSSNGDEAIDFNAYCSDICVDTVFGIATTEKLLDINESGDITVGKVQGIQESEGLVKISSDSGPRWTEKSARGNSNNITIGSVKGVTNSGCIAARGGNPIKDLTIKNIDVKVSGTTETRAVNINHEIENQYDNCYLEGRAANDNGNRYALQFGFGPKAASGTSSNVTIDMVVSGQRGGQVAFVEESDITIKGYDCSFRGISFHETVSDSELTALGHNMTSGFGVELATTDCRLTGHARGNNNTDLVITSDAEGNKIDFEYDTITNNGTNTIESQYSAL